MIHFPMAQTKKPDSIGLFGIPTTQNQRPTPHEKPAT
jgi:hypothetical protein